MSEKLTKYFYTKEFIDPDTYKQYGEMSIQFIDKRIVQGADLIREHFGKPVTINNYHVGGTRVFSGLRPFDCKIGAKRSQHKYGRAIDFLVQGVTPQEVYAEILKNWDEKFSKVFTTLENIKFTESWCHADSRFLPESIKTPFIVNP